ncbi:MAG TPA: hypothetical protein VFJ85_10145 [Acidimicrobiales bacterium]|nr:hypothetical protein [Acidimicrobiales bacterium]
MHTRTTATWSVHERHDRDQASDGHSRYGAYLDSRLHHLVGDGQPSPEAWAAWCWNVATPPTMGPGYARWSDPVESTTCWRSCEDGRLAATVVVRVPASALAVELPRPWRGWERDVDSELVEPRTACSALARVTLEGPLEGTWPAAPDGLFDGVERRVLVAAAKAAVAAVVDGLRWGFGPAVDALRVGGGRR